jgi:uncharacterized membrane protein YeaQ/YmgE (transglycosylase-associated protein family)
VGALAWIVFGLLAGAVARVVVPGHQRFGCIVTLCVGLAGALIGGLIGQVVLGHHVRFGWRLGPFVLAVVGSVVLLLALEALSGRGRRRGPF